LDCPDNGGAWIIDVQIREVPLYANCYYKNFENVYLPGTDPDSYSLLQRFIGRSHPWLIEYQKS